jgi:hypothetical protein
MDMFIFDLSRKEGVSRIWKNTFEEIYSSYWQIPIEVV